MAVCLHSDGVARGRDLVSCIDDLQRDLYNGIHEKHEIISNPRAVSTIPALVYSHWVSVFISSNPCPCSRER